MRLARRLVAVVALGAWLAACRSSAAERARGAVSPRRSPPAWTRGAVCYEIFVRSFSDSDGDGIGDLRGLTRKLDYIDDGDPRSRTDLGARCIWLMPVAESPSYHGYDVTNYYRVDPDYGTNEDFRHLVAEAHRRGIHVLVDMVLNHVSSQHPFFQEALRDPRAPHRDWFRWSATEPKETWPSGQPLWHRSPVSAEWYYGIFWENMPDLNYATRAVREEAKRIATFWLTEMGVDGFRLDAVPYLVEEDGRRVGTAGTHAFLREYAAHVRRVAPEAFTVGEVWDGIEPMKPYYPDQLDAYFAFDLSDALLAAVRTGSARELQTLYARFQREIPDGRYAPFLRNHDQTRTLTALGDSSIGSAPGLARAKMAATLLLTLPGVPFVYYGEEIGMTGDKPDERLRTPMQWSAATGAGFTRGTPWEAPRPDWRTTNVAAQEGDPGSLLARYRRLIHLRAENVALGAGDLVPLETASDAVAAYLRRDGEHAVLVVANLGGASVANVRLASRQGVLPAGRYAVRSLLGGAPGAELTVGADGRVGDYAPVAVLGAMESGVYEVARVGR